MELDGLRVAVLAGEGVEDLEYWVTVMRLREEGALVTSAGLKRETVHGKNGLAIPVEVEVGSLAPADFDALVVPGGHMPDKLRRFPAVTDFVAAIHAAGKPIGIICHGGLIAISARIVAGRRATGSLESATTSSTPGRRGSTSRPSAKGTWSGVGWSRTSRPSAASSWPPSRSTGPPGGPDPGASRGSRPPSRPRRGSAAVQRRPVPAPRTGLRPGGGSGSAWASGEPGPRMPRRRRGSMGSAVSRPSR